MYIQCPIWISDVIEGFFMVPDGKIWNYNIIGLPIESQTRKIFYEIDNPLEYFNEKQRRTNFINFCRNE